MCHASSSYSSNSVTVSTCLFVCVSCLQDSDYVIAERNFVTDDRSKLSFHKGDVIRLQVMDGLERGETQRDMNDM